MVPQSPVLLHDLLCEHGYTKKDIRMPHEFACMAKPGSMTVDIHNYFPVWRMMEDSPFPANAKLEYETLIKNSIAMSPANSVVRVPNATVCAFLHICHAMHDLIEPPVTLGLAKIRLGELCEIVDFMTLPEFQPGLFNDLVSELGGMSAVNVIGGLIRAFGIDYGDSAIFDQNIPLSQVPRDTGWGALIHLADSPYDLLIRKTPLRDCLPVGTFKGLTIDERAVHPVSTYSDCDSDSTLQLSSLTRETSADMNYSAEFSRTRDDLQIRFGITSRSTNFLDEIRLIFDDVQLLTGYRHDLKQVRIGAGIQVPKTPLWTWTSDTTISVELTIPLRELNRFIHNGEFEFLIVRTQFTDPPSHDWNEFFKYQALSNIGAHSIKLE